MELEAVCRRRYQLQDTALEFFLDSGESHLLVFQSVGLAQEVAATLGRAGVPSKLRTSNLAATTKLWCQGRITNFQVGNLRNSPPERSSGWALNLAERLQYSLFSGVCDGGRDIQFLVVEVSVTGAGDWTFSF